MSWWWMSPSTSAIMPPKRRGQSPRFQVLVQQREQLLGMAGVVLRQPDGVDPIGEEPAPGQSRGQASPVEFVVADHVCHHIAHCPACAQGRAFPPLGFQCREEGGEVGPFIARQAPQVHDPPALVRTREPDTRQAGSSAAAPSCTRSTSTTSSTSTGRWSSRSCWEAVAVHIFHPVRAEQ